MRKAIVYSKRLEAAGLTRAQVEAHIEILEEIVEDEMATKADIQSLKSEMTNQLQSLRSDMTNQISGMATKADLQDLRSEMMGQIHLFRSEMVTKTEFKTEIQDVRTDIQDIRAEVQDIKSLIAQQELKMTVKVGAMLAATIGLLVALLKGF